MAGWSKSSYKKPKNPKRPVRNEVDYDNTKLLFIEVLTIFIKQVTGDLFYRPLPPMLGDGKSVDLFKLYLVVRENGGYEGVCENGLWGLMAENCGFNSGNGFGLKLVYVKYLDVFEKWMLRVKRRGAGECELGEVELDLKEVLAKVEEEKARDGGNGKWKLMKKGDDGVEVRGLVGLNGNTGGFECKSNLDEEHMKFVDGKDDSLIKSSRKRKKGKNVKCKLRKKGEEVCDDDVEGQAFEGLSESIVKFDSKSNLDEEHLQVVGGKDDSLMKSSMVEKDCFSRKRKKGGNVKCKLRQKSEEACEDGAKGRGFEGLNGSTEGFEGKSNLDEEHLKFVDGKDDSLTKSSVVEKDCISRKRKKGENVNCKLSRKGEAVCADGVEGRSFEGLNEGIERFEGKSNLGSNVITRSLKFVDGADDSLKKSSRKRKKGENVNCKLRKKGEEVCDDGVEVWSLKFVDGADDSLKKSSRKRNKGENVNCKLRMKGEEVCDGDAEARRFVGLNGNTEGFDGKSKVKDIEENKNFVYDEEQLKFVNGTDGSLTKSSMVKEDCISRKRKKGENVNCKLRKKAEEVCDDVEAGGFEGLNGSIVKFDGKSNLDEEHLKFVDGTNDSLTKISMVEEDCISRKRKRAFDTIDGEQLCDGVEARGFGGLNGSTEGFDGKSNLDSNVITRSVVYEEENLKFVDGTDDSLTKSSVVEEDCISRKRKRESYLDLVKWVSEVARNPCDPAIGILPERSKWKDYGTEVVWKQVLLMRDDMLLKRDVDTCGQYSILQIKQKMHPSIYDDTSGSGRLRCSQRVLSAKDHLKKMRAQQFSVSPSSSHSGEDQVDGPTSAELAVGFWWKQRRKRIPVGSQFQADVPKWIEEVYESDSKWLGMGIWPLDKRGKKRTLIDRGPIGKGRQDTCGCKSRGSYDCVKFHLSEKRRKLKIDLGSAYYQWKFDYMGEEVALSWLKEEEQKFQDIVKSNPLSEEKSFWNEIFKFFSNKNRESLVSYYFNVFLLRRRGNQNRSHASNVDSDDDESEYGPRFDCFGRDAKFSIFRSPRKSTPGSEAVQEF
ncbi:uncharacterized protein LOC107870610 isoform X1 [Capsicum annuum]|nr:uncharacterized protein LOC107870610 isoform X1 [Capsicum annuum]